MEPAASPLDSPNLERRRHARYHLVERVFIRKRNGSSHPATTNEISISGLSATSTAILQPGEEVHLSPVVGQQVNAIVRRKIGTEYGFEFISAPPNLISEILILCRGLLPFRGTPADA